MTHQQYTNYIFLPLYGLVTVMVIAQWLRYQDRLRRNVALLFLVTMAGQAFPKLLPAALGLDGFSWVLVSTAYFLAVRSLEHLRPIPVWIEHASRTGWLVLVVGAIIDPFMSDTYSLILGRVIDIYGVLAMVHTGVVVMSGALRTGGVSRRRLILVATGVTLLGILTMVTVLLPRTEAFAYLGKVLTTPILPLLYLGLATPRWLTNIWQQQEFYAFFRESGGLPIKTRAEAMLARLVPTATHTVGALATAAAMVEKESGQLNLVSDSRALSGKIHVDSGGVLYGVVNSGQPVYLDRIDSCCDSVRERAERIGARAMMVVPIATKEQTFGYLMVFLRSAALFPESDLSLLSLMTEQVAVALSSTAMLKEQQTLASRLEVANADLEQASRAKSAFLANMSHELRTPLNAIIGYSEMLQEEALEIGDRQFVSDLNRIHGAGRHLLSLINDILDLSKIEAGRMELHLEPVCIADMVEGIVATVQPLVEKNQNRLVVDCPTGSGVVTLDLTRVRQVLFNLLSNAAKFTEHGTITLRVSQQRVAGQPWYYFAVTDTGIGMTEEQTHRIFHDFTQADSSTTRKYGGTGLGLAISQRIARLLGGEIDVASRPGEGSTFTFRLPSEGAVPVTSPPDKAAALPTILAIDTDPTVRELISRFLTRDGFRVETATNGIEGLRRARELQPDLITLALLMPILDGWAVLKTLKADPALKQIPVVIISMQEERTMGLALGAVDYLVKPVDWASLGDRLRPHLRARGHEVQEVQL